MLFIQTNPTPEIKNFLMQDEILNLNMLGIMKSMPEAEIFVDDLSSPTGVMIRQNPYMHFIYTKSTDFLDALCDTFFTEGEVGFSGVSEPIADYLLARYKEDWKNPCALYYMPKENLDLSLKTREVKPLNLRYASLVDEFYPYRGDHSLDAILDNLKHRPSSAIFVEGEPVSWVMVHEDYSIGIMHTLEDHRRKGYAIDVTIDLCDQLMKIGEIPFLQIVADNQMSPGLAQKCGFKYYGNCVWLGITITE